MAPTISPPILSAVADTPIHLLSPDLLWSIIKLNTDLFSTDHALQSTRHYSQVCRSWREFILQSPSLWGKLIDLDDLFHSANFWKYEVLRRSGTSLLWIKGNIHSVPSRKSSSLLAFFFLILNSHWDRIQKIDICFDPGTKKRLCRDWRAIYRPSPHLQVFRVQPASFVNSVLSTSPTPLFAHKAPSLHTFECGLTFSVNAPWLSTLRVVCFGYPLTLSQILDGLRAMPRLSTLKIEAFAKVDFQANPAGSVNQEPVDLPDLTQLYLYAAQPIYLCILSYLRIPPSCSLAMQPNAPALENDFPNEALNSPLPALSQFTNCYFRSHRPSTLWVKTSSGTFFFGDREPGQPSYAPIILPTPFFSLVIGSPILTPKKVRVLFRELSLSSPELGSVSVTHLHLYMMYGLPITFTSFASSLPSISTLTTDDNTLGFLLVIQKCAAKILFPLLRVVKLTSEPENQVRPQGEHLLSFLRWRQSAGYPVEVLNLTGYMWPYRLKLVEERLQDLSGLNILRSLSF